MKKLSLDDLRVESYASQVSEQELAEVKGGTAAWLCVIPAAWELSKVLWEAYNDMCAVSGGATPDKQYDGISFDAYGSDSTKVYPDGTLVSYGGDSTKVTINW